MTDAALRTVRRCPLDAGRCLRGIHNLVSVTGLQTVFLVS